MKNTIVALIVFFAAMKAFTSYSAHENRSYNLEKAGAGETADRFAKSCRYSMRRHKAWFTGGAPTPQYGCICIGVKLQNLGVLTQTTLPDFKQTYREFVKVNKDRMATYSTRRVRKLKTKNEEAAAIAEAIFKQYNFCDTYNLQGRKRIDESAFKNYRR